MYMQGAWACPDLGKEKPEGSCLPIPGSKEEFPECPAAYLRTARDVELLKDRGVNDPFSAHLIDESIHPAHIVAEAAFELKNGGRPASGMSPKLLSLVHLWLREEAARDAYASELRRSKNG